MTANHGHHQVVVAVERPDGSLTPAYITSEVELKAALLVAVIVVVVVVVVVVVLVADRSSSDHTSSGGRTSG